MMNETKNDFAIILHDERGTLYPLIKSKKVREHTIPITRSMICDLYPDGWLDMFLSNHWSLMWYYQRHVYDYYWTIEYDVKVVGDSNRIWSIKSEADLLYPMGNKKVSSVNRYTKTVKGIDHPLYAGFVQISRYSKRALDYLDSQYKKGINAQDEIAIFSLLRHGGFSLDDKPLGRLIQGIWTFDTFYHQQNRDRYDYLKKWATADDLYIMHPIKS